MPDRLRAQITRFKRPKLQDPAFAFAASLVGSIIASPGYGLAQDYAIITVYIITLGLCFDAAHVCDSSKDLQQRAYVLLQGCAIFHNYQAAGLTQHGFSAVWPR